MLTISSLTRDNYQQTRLFIDSVFAFQFCVSLASWEIFFHKKKQPLPAISLIDPHPTLKEKQTISSHRINFSLYRNVNEFCIVNLYLSLPPPAPTATHILAHPAAKYLSIRVCPKFAISHFASHHVIFEKTSADMVAQFPQRPFYSPCKLRAIKQQIAKTKDSQEQSDTFNTIYLQVDNVQH